MNQPEAQNSNAKRPKFFILETIAGLLIGGIIGFMIGLEVGPLIVPLLVKPSIFILDPGAIIVGFLIIGLCTLIGASAGIYVARRLARRTK